MLNDIAYNNSANVIIAIIFIAIIKYKYKFKQNNS